MPILCQSLAKSVHSFLALSDRADKFRELWCLIVLTFRFQMVDQKVVYFLVDIRLDLILFYSKAMTSATDVIELDTGPEIVLMTVTMVSVDLVAGVGVEEEAAVVVVVVVDTDPPRQDVVDGMYYNCNNEFQKIFIMQLIKVCWKFTSAVSDLWQVGGILLVLRFPPPIKLTATI